MIRIILCSLFIVSCAQAPIIDSELSTSHRANFIIVNTMCGYPVKMMFSIKGILDGEDIDPEDKYSLANFATFLTIFTQDQRHEAPLDNALMSVAKIRCN